MNRKKILVPIELHPEPANLLHYACLIAKIMNARISFVHVIEDANTNGENIRSVEVSNVQNRRTIGIKLSEIISKVLKDEMIIYEIIVTKGIFHQRITKIADELNVSLIIINKCNYTRLRELIDSLSIPVISCFDCKFENCNNILLPLNFNSMKSLSIQKVTDLALLLKANINIISFFSDNDLNREIEFKAKLAEIKSQIEKENISCITRFYSDKSTNSSIIQRWADEENIDLLILPDLEQITNLEIQNSYYNLSHYCYGLPVIILSADKDNYNTDVLDKSTYCY